MCPLFFQLFACLRHVQGNLKHLEGSRFQAVCRWSVNESYLLKASIKHNDHVGRVEHSCHMIMLGVWSTCHVIMSGVWSTCHVIMSGVWNTCDVIMSGVWNTCHVIMSGVWSTSPHDITIVKFGCQVQVTTSVML